MKTTRFIAAAIAIVLVAAFVWKPPQLNARLQSLLPNEEVTPTPSPAPSPTPTATQEPLVATPTPELPPPRFETCVDGSKLTVTGVGDDWIYYRCESGALGSYLK